MTDNNQKMKKTNVTLRAFRINNPNLSKQTSGVRILLEDKLMSSNKAEDRCLILNSDDITKEQDLISFYDSNGKEQSLFCTMLRMAPGNEVHHITKALLQGKKFSIDKLENQDLQTAGIYKSHYYFSILDDYLVTAVLPLNRTIKQLQTYLSWLLNDELLELTPLIEPPKECKLSDLDFAVFQEPDFSEEPNVSEKQDDFKGNSGIANQSVMHTKQHYLSLDMVKKVIGTLFDSGKKIEEIDDLAQIVSAQLLIKFRKPKEMDQEQYERILGATLKPVSDLENVKFKTKNNKQIIKGKDLVKTKIIEIEKTDSGYLSEEQLKQEMAKYLRDLKNEDCR